MRAKKGENYKPYPLDHNDELPSNASVLVDVRNDIEGMNFNESVHPGFGGVDVSDLASI